MAFRPSLRHEVHQSVTQRWPEGHDKEAQNGENAQPSFFMRKRYQ
jgi:hypothetical protein